MSTFGFVKVGAATPKLKVADIEYNISEIEKLIKEAHGENIAVLVFPELCVTGYTCGDLFLQKLFLDKALEYLEELLNSTKNIDVLTLLGLPILIEDKLFNCAVAIHRGDILGVVPKMYLPNHKEFYEKRWFTSGFEVSNRLSEIKLLGRRTPFGNIIFQSETPGFNLGIEICEDLWSVIPPSSYLALKGASIIANLSASNELVAKSEYRQPLVTQQSCRCISGYIYAAAGVYESTTDTVFSGDSVIAENGITLVTAKRFSRESTLISTEIDVERLISERQGNKTFADTTILEGTHKKFQIVNVTYSNNNEINETNFNRDIWPHPFIPGDPTTRDKRCEEIFNIQVTGLAKRLEHTKAKQAVIGISGGLDSTLALLVTVKTFDLLDIPRGNILAITMPGFGTTDQTYNNAIKLMLALKVTIKEIDIKPACLQHFKDIEHDEDIHDVTYENVQARERTQILMDLANKTGGLVIGTGDLSELALGWATYNGDHMSHYGVNCGVPKTLVKYLVKWVADNIADQNTQEVLEKILATPISPELLPPDAEGKIEQKTEDIVGPYELHDFFLYYAIRHGMPPKKIAFLAGQAFKEKYPQEIIVKWLQVFYKRFFSQQFKRSCLPDGPKVGTISLSPRADWRMPSDAEVKLWLDELN